MRIPKRRGEWRRDLGPADEFLTPEAIQGLKDELKRIETARPEAVSELQRTREMGDLSENFAYSVAKGKVMGMDKRIFEIKEQLKRVKPLTIGSSGGKIAVGSIVTVETGGKQKTLTLVGERQVDLLKGFISYHSPVGAALLNHVAGETVTVAISADGGNDRSIEYKILKVE